FREHMQQCARCRSAYADFIDLLHNKLPLMDPEANSPSRLVEFLPQNSSYRERFLARARRQGLAVGPARNSFWMSARTWLRPTLGYKQITALAMGVLLAVVGILGYNLRLSKVRTSELNRDSDETSKPIPARDSSISNSVDSRVGTDVIAVNAQAD